MVKLKDIARKLTLKHAQNFPPTMPSAPGNNDSVQIPKAPRLPIEFVPSAPISEFTVKNPERSEELPKPTLRSEEVANFPDWKYNLINTINHMHQINIFTPLYAENLTSKVNKAKHPNEVAHIKMEIVQELQKAEHHAIAYANKVKKLRSNLDK